MTDLPGIELDALAAYLQRAQITATGDLEVTLISGGRSNLTFEVTAGAEEFVLRRPPLGELPSTAHDMTREATVMSGLAAGDVPVPEVVDLCEDASVLGAPFLLMRRAPGRALRTVAEVSELSAQTRNDLYVDLVDVLARLHLTEPDAVGLEYFGRPSGFAGRQVRTWSRQLAAVGTRPLPALEDLGARLNRTVPDDWGARIVHGDFRLDNCLAVDGRVTAVLDWELSTLGHPLADLATFVVYHDGLADHPNPVVEAPGRIPGSPGIEDLLERYATATGRDLSGLGWYVGLAWFKLAVILEGILRRVSSGTTPGVAIEGVADLVLTAADAGHEALLATT